MIAEDIFASLATSLFGSTTVPIDAVARYAFECERVFLEVQAGLPGLELPAPGAQSEPPLPRPTPSPTPPAAVSVPQPDGGFASVEMRPAPQPFIPPVPPFAPNAPQAFQAASQAAQAALYDPRVQMTPARSQGPGLQGAGVPLPTDSRVQMAPARNSHPIGPGARVSAPIVNTSGQ